MRPPTLRPSDAAPAPNLRQANPKIFSLGGCAELKVSESCLIGPKIEGQAKSVAHNIKASAGVGKLKLKAHAEAEPTMKFAPVVEVNRAPSCRLAVFVAG